MSETIYLNIDGMTCNHCVAAVQKALAAVDGVDDVIVNLERGGATVTGNVSIDALLQAVRQAGYQART